ncbi:hypothetical protein [Streptomyces sp. NPDC048636]|uniref:hypothetical protein n=1 Tax=Streptomyces sp. NPDC048636 TaxID=3155762 RepID=UPI0034499DEE
MTAGDDTTGKLADAFGPGDAGGDGTAVFDWLHSTGVSDSGSAGLPVQNRPVPAEKQEVLSLDPPGDASPIERLHHYEAIIDSEREQYRQTLDAADERFNDRTNEVLWRINKEKAYRNRKSKATGKKFTNFKDYLAERHSISRAHGYRILNEFPVARALVGVAPDGYRFSTRQVPKLISVFRAHGAEKVQEVWKEAGEDVTPAGLERAIDRLGLASPETEKLDELSSSGDQGGKTVVDRWDHAVRSLDPSKARQILASDPTAAKRLYDQLKPFVDALAEVAELPGS